jgi:hypothetical protein
MFRSLRRLALAVLCAAPALAAQQNVGINLSRGPVTVTGVLCGFDCNDPNNLMRVRVSIFDSLTVRLIGDANRPATLVFGIGPTPPACPFLRIPGIGNSLLIDPPTLVLGPLVAALSGPNRWCGTATASQAVATLSIPAAASGALISLQGLTFDAGRPAFTRAIELVIL